MSAYHYFTSSGNLCRTRFTAHYVASLADMPAGENWDPADVKYTSVSGPNLDAVISEACARDINGECYGVCREVWTEVCPGDGIYEWVAVSDIDYISKREYSNE